MAKDKSSGSFKLKYEISEKDSDASALIQATMKHTPGKIRVDIEGGIPGIGREQLAAIHLLLSEKLNALNDTLASQTGNHVATLRTISTYCNELANLITVGEVIDEEG